MAKLKNGIYTEKSDSECTLSELERKLRVKGDLRTKCAEMLAKSDAKQYNAAKDIQELRDRTRIDPETGKSYYI